VGQHDVAQPFRPDKPGAVEDPHHYTQGPF
jgi:hypothetical protein